VVGSQPETSPPFRGVEKEPWIRPGTPPAPRCQRFFSNRSFQVTFSPSKQTTLLLLTGVEVARQGPLRLKHLFSQHNYRACFRQKAIHLQLVINLQPIYHDFFGHNHLVVECLIIFWLYCFASCHTLKIQALNHLSDLKESADPHGGVQTPPRRPRTTALTTPLGDGGKSGFSEIK